MAKLPSVLHAIKMHLADKCTHKSSNQSENIFEEVDSESDSEPEEIHIVL